MGPTSQPAFRAQGRRVKNTDRGPWTGPSHYLEEIAIREINSLKEYTTRESMQSILGESPLNPLDEAPWKCLDSSPPQPLGSRSKSQEDPAVHIDLYKKFLEVTGYILPKGELSKPVLWHPYLRPANTFVENDRVISMIGSQHAWVGPLFHQARHTQLIVDKDETMVRILYRYESLDKVRDRGDRKRLQHQVQRSLMLHCYESEMQAARPLMNDVMHLPQGQNRRYLVTFFFERLGMEYYTSSAVSDEFSPALE
ncbi:hypothetical protein BKA58DRAFT_50031 [Alternaria rosae]|uniref:uncharacterized protein n=1 Tax=Alternaria rosae TaxID=1187941 RepID=UPI001E8DBA8A|nr:uncharacterized protein BKA58DRAFT_50031 [Alternaria rosae]KAH6858887.1 hypothetical protein BKA58DRAFT_50031 [Alternaria rosae]